MDTGNIIIGTIAYLIGAIPTGYLIAQCKGIADIRAHGSGNIGATNVSRLLGIRYFFLIFLLDAGKAYLFMHMVGPHTTNNHLLMYAALLLLGNCCSVFLQGSGGKGIATLFGLLMALNPTCSAFLLALWAAALLVTRTIGIASIIAVVGLPVYVCMKTDTNWWNLFCHNPTPFCFFALFASSLILFKHRSNMNAYWNK